MVLGYTGDIDFVTTDPPAINELFRVNTDGSKSVDYTAYVSDAGAFKTPEYGDGWAFIGGLNTTNFTISKENIDDYDGVAVYPVKSLLLGAAENVVLTESESVVIGPYTPFYTHITLDTKIAAYSEDCKFTFKNQGLSFTSATYRSANENVNDLLYFALSSDKDHSLGRFYLTFADHYSESFKASEDAMALTTSSETSPMVWCLDRANQELVVDGLPMKDERKVGMGFSVPEAGEYTFRLDARTLTDVRTVILVDSVTGKKVDLLQNPYSYSFTSEAINNANNRFTLYINSSPTDIPVTDAGKPYAYAKNNLLTVKNLSEGDAVSIHDLSGRTLVSNKVSGTEFSTVVDQKGVYIVTVKGEKTNVLKVLNK
jgi:hypothetical protein